VKGSHDVKSKIILNFQVKAFSVYKPNSDILAMIAVTEYRYGGCH
jgi:hypothetical protein